MLLFYRLVFCFFVLRRQRFVSEHGLLGSVAGSCLTVLLLSSWYGSHWSSCLRLRGSRVMTGRCFWDYVLRSALKLECFNNLLLLLLLRWVVQNVIVSRLLRVRFFVEESVDFLALAWRSWILRLEFKFSLFFFIDLWVWLAKLVRA